MESSDFMPLALDTLYTQGAYAASKSSSTSTAEELESLGYTVKDSSEDLGLDFNDFLQLMVAQLQNQTIDNTADTSDMINQLVQMSVVQMMSSVKTSLDTLSTSSTMTYAASLVGKTVTVGTYDEEGNIQEVVGEVTGTGTYQGSMVIFVNGEMYPLNSIMAVGTLPEVPEGGDSGESGSGTGGETAGQEQTQTV
ncbi:MAG: flagellar hook capping FlgD N-terminal domain-containing protein [Oscillospiraceae bacterium]|nr:flagellar hook capping FlgD N-terminal domain-containing protein [Oscillospiraceae bacterium]